MKWLLKRPPKDPMKGPILAKKSNPEANGMNCLLQSLGSKNELPFHNSTKPNEVPSRIRLSLIF
jgi:hypothetical protein